MAVEHARLFAETRRLLQQTQEQSDQLQLIMDTVPAGMLLLDDQQRVLLANPLAQAYLADLHRHELQHTIRMWGTVPFACCQHQDDPCCQCSHERIFSHLEGRFERISVSMISLSK